MVRETLAILTAGTTVLFGTYLYLAENGKRKEEVDQNDLLADRYRQKQEYLRNLQKLYDNNAITKKQYEDQLFVFAETYKLEQLADVEGG